MTTVPEYVDLFFGGLVQIATHLGTDPSSADMTTRAIIQSQLALLGTVVKVLVDHGVITDQQLIDTFNQALEDVWPTLPPS